MSFEMLEMIQRKVCREYCPHRPLDLERVYSKPLGAHVPSNHCVGRRLPISLIFAATAASEADQRFARILAWRDLLYEAIPDGRKVDKLTAP